MIERTVHPSRRLGRRPPTHAPALRFASFWTGAIPAHPTAADHLGQVSEWELGGNDQFGTCGPTSVANMRRQVVAYLAPGGTLPTLEDIYDLYRRSGNPGFNPNLPADDPRQEDGGVDMQTMLGALLKDGIGGVKPVAFAKVDSLKADQLRAAIAIFGGLLYGVDLEVAQQAQTDAGLWDYRNSAEWGGHAILAGRYKGASKGEDVAVVTWQMVVGTTDAFETHQLEEAWVVIWPEHLGSVAFQEGVDRAALAAAYQAVTGRPLPTVDPPAPTPTPADPLHELAALMRQFITDVNSWLERHGL